MILRHAVFINNMSRQNTDRNVFGLCEIGYNVYLGDFYLSLPGQKGSEKVDFDLLPVPVSRSLQTFTLLLIVQWPSVTQIQ